MFERVFLFTSVQHFEEVLILASTTLPSSSNIMGVGANGLSEEQREGGKLGTFCIYYISFN